MSSRFAKLFGARVRELRERKGLSQEELADAAKLHRTHISLIERGHRSARLETIELLARALRVQPSELLPPIDLKARRPRRLGPSSRRPPNPSSKH